MSRAPRVAKELAEVRQALNTVEHDAYPRIERERYRLYVLRPDGDRHVISTTPTAQGLGLALITAHEEGELTGMPVGVLDAVAGTWIINPWEKP